MLRITEYAQRLIDDLDDLDFIERVKIQQKNWIGRSTGAEVTFKATAGDDIVVYTTRPDTLFGATYMVLFAGASHCCANGWRRACWPMRRKCAPISGRLLPNRDLERTELNKEKDRRMPGR